MNLPAITRLLTCCLLFAALLLGQNLTAQDNKEKIAKALEEYFDLERENIHVHLDKNIFMPTEKIWFKGYMYHRKKSMPFFPSTNIFVNLMDSDGKIVDTELLYGSSGNFSGSLPLTGLKTGKYYLQFYTNWMNNFAEDESAVYEVTVINPEDGPNNLLKSIPAEVSITLSPEGGSLINGIRNLVGIQVLGCNQKPVNISEATVLDSNGNVLEKIQINKQGYGKFDIQGNKPGKVVVQYNNTQFEQVLPPVLSTGIAMEVNSYTSATTTITLRTNKQTLEADGSKPFLVAIHQDDKYAIYEADFKGNTELIIPISSSELFPGVNTIRILDSSLNQVAERMIYNHTITITDATVEKDRPEWEYDREYKIQLKPNMNASIAVLPMGTTAIDETYDLYGDLLISPYLEKNSKIFGRQYLGENTRGKKYELDLLLLNHKSKYSWNNILNNPPKSDYNFDIGLSLKCKIDKKLRSKSDYKVKITSASAMIDESVDLNDENEFYLNHLIVADSTYLRFTLFEDRIKKESLKLTPIVSNADRKYNKPFSPPATCATFLPPTETEADIPLPNYRLDIVNLDEVTVKAKGTKLRYEKGMGNSQLRGYKISETDSRNFFYILDLIRYHGFDVENDGLHVGIYGRTVNTINGQRTTPMVWVDNMPIMSFDQLLGIYTDDVDELYIHPHVPAPSVANKMGWIKIYMKKDFSHWDKKKKQEASYIVKNGFQKIVPFTNADYTSFSDKGFVNFGILDWQPLAIADENGVYKLTLPYYGEGPVKLVIEGINPDGSVYSGVQVINR